MSATLTPVAHLAGPVVSKGPKARSVPSEGQPRIVELGAMVLDIGVGIEGYTEVELDGIPSRVTGRMRSSQERFIKPRV